MNCFKKGKLSVDEIKKWLIDLRSYCYVPVSDFCVSAVVRVAMGDRDDYYFSGVNIENIDHVLSMHAEESAIAIMSTAMGSSAKIKEVWVMGAKRSVLACEDFCSCCGKCRQHISEFSDKDAKIHYVTLSGAVETHTIAEILPDAFSLRDKSNKYAKKLSIDEINANLINNEAAEDIEILPWLKNLDAIDFISNHSKRVVLKIKDAGFVAGVSVESSAFLSISAIQSAIALAISEYKNIKIAEVHLYASGKGNYKLNDNQFMPLSLAEIQVLREFSLNDDIPVRIYTDGGKNISVSMLRNVIFTYSSKKKIHEI